MSDSGGASSSGLAGTASDVDEDRSPRQAGGEERALASTASEVVVKSTSDGDEVKRVKKKGRKVAEATKKAIAQVDKTLAFAKGLLEAPKGGRKKSVEGEAAAGKENQDVKETAKRSELHAMVALGRTVRVEELIRFGADKEGLDRGRTPLQVAAMLGQTNVAALLVKMNCKVETRDSNGMTPLHLAAYHKQAPTLELLVRYAQLDATVETGMTAMHLAAAEGNVDEVEVLAASDANLEARDEFHDTPLRSAVRWSQAAVVQRLVYLNADTEARDEEKVTAVHIAACKERLDCLHALVENRGDLQARDENELSPLHFAVRAGDVEACQAILAAAADPSPKDAHGQAPLHHAVLLNEVPVLTALLEAACDIEVTDERGLTPLHTAVRDGLREVAEALLSLHAQLKAKTHGGDQPLHLACIFNKPPLVVLLLQHKADVMAKAKRNQTPLHICAENGRDQCLSNLLSPAYRPDVARAMQESRGQGLKLIALSTASKNQLGQTPLHLAAWRGFASLCDTLIQNQAVVDAEDSKGTTPVQLAVRKNHVKVVQRLLKLQASRTQVNAYGMGLLQQAAVDNAPDVVAALREARLEPKWDEIEAWQRPLALATFYKNQPVIDILCTPPPATKLSLTMPKVHMATITVSFQAMNFEPLIYVLCLQAKLSTSEWMTAGITRAIENFKERKRVKDVEALDKPVFTRNMSAKEVQDEEAKAHTFTLKHVEVDALETGETRVAINDDVWASGGQASITVPLGGRKYSLRLVAANEAGISYGKPIEVMTPTVKS